MRSFLNKLINAFHLKELVSESPFLYWVVISYRRIFWTSTKSTIENRKKLSLFDYRDLSKPLSAYPFYYVLENNYYGHGEVLSRQFNIDDCTRIEHGSFLGNYVPKHNYFKAIRNIVTFSDYRRSCNLVTNKNITCVGPYIKYAQSILNDEQKKLIKKELGRVLLVFPSHSIDALHAVFDVKDFIDFVLTKKNEFGFDSVVVCLYWKDIELGMDKYYLEQNFKVVTAGHTYDYYFLDRLRSIIELSDYTISNEVGTHLAYCVTLNKPHFLYVSKIKYISNTKSMDAKRIAGIRSFNEQNVSTTQKQEIIDCFSEWHCQVTDRQLKCVEYYWGDFG